MQTTDNREPAYHFRTWHELRRPQYHVAVPPLVLARLEHALGTVPATLDSEEAVQTWAAETFLPLCDADIEDAVLERDADVRTFPHKAFASRAWARAEYEKFYAWAVENGWVQPPVAEESPAEEPKRVRRRREEAAAP